MLRSVHDDAVSDALDELLAGARVVGVMGGHAIARGTDAYARRGPARPRAGPRRVHGGHRRRPRRDGGGEPRRVRRPVRRRACSTRRWNSSRRPRHFTPVGHRLGARRLRRAGPLAGGGTSVGIPTWFYGHEPPNAFASHIAKYFANATREDGLLARSNAGVVFLPGAAGTVQEIFDNATPNYYESRGEPTPMVLVDRAHWTERLPTWPLLQALAARPFDGVPDRAGRLRRRGPGGAGPAVGAGLLTAPVATGGSWPGFLTRPADLSPAEATHVPECTSA